MENVYLGFANEFGLKYLMPESGSDEDQLTRRIAFFPDCIAFWSVLDSEVFAQVEMLLNTDCYHALAFLKTHATRFGRLT